MWIENNKYECNNEHSFMQWFEISIENYKKVRTSKKWQEINFYNIEKDKINKEDKKKRMRKNNEI